MFTDIDAERISSCYGRIFRQPRRGAYRANDFRGPCYPPSGELLTDSTDNEYDERWTVRGSVGSDRT
jgi:hypothetical protein